MTEYGRGQGSEPWHPEDPLYGDGGWTGQEADAAQSPYGGQPQHYPQEPQQSQYGNWGTSALVPSTDAQFDRDCVSCHTGLVGDQDFVFTRPGALPPLD